MKPTAFIALVLVPLLSSVYAQNPVISTSLSTPGNSINLTPSSLPASTTSGAGGISGSQSLSGAVNGSSIPASATTTTPGPTAPTNVNGGGSGGAGGGAPAPGQSGPNGIYGPSDGYISAGEILDITLVLGSVIGAVTGGLLVFA